MAEVQPLVSILVPAFNAGATIQRALSSLIAQTVESWEAILVDDGSTDATWDRAASVSDHRIRRFKLPTNVGRGAARQFALRQSAGSFICLQDADDWCYPWKLERQLEALERHPEASLVSSAMASVGEDGSLRGIWRDTSQDTNPELTSPLVSLFGLRFPRAPCMLRSVVAREFEYCSRLLRAEEFHYLARALKRKRFLVLGEALYAYCDEGSFSREGPASRYVWSARASLRLVRNYPISASILLAKKVLQVVLSLFSPSRCTGSRLKPLPPSREEIREFERACLVIDDVMARVVRTPQ